MVLYGKMWEGQHARAGFVQLVCLHDELLAQQRAGHAGGADVLQEVEGALEVARVREHAQARSAARLVLPRDLQRICKCN